MHNSNQTAILYQCSKIFQHLSVVHICFVNNLLVRSVLVPQDHSSLNILAFKMADWLILTTLAWLPFWNQCCNLFSCLIYSFAVLHPSNNRRCCTLESNSRDCIITPLSKSFSSQSRRSWTKLITSASHPLAMSCLHYIEIYHVPLHLASDLAWFTNSHCYFHAQNWWFLHYVLSNKNYMFRYSRWGDPSLCGTYEQGHCNVWW